MEERVRQWAGGYCIDQQYTMPYTYPDTEVDLTVPFWILLIPDDSCAPFVPSKVHNAVGVNQLLLYRSNSEDLLDSLKIPGIHLWKVLPSDDTDGESPRDQSNARRAEEVSRCDKITTCLTP